MLVSRKDIGSICDVYRLNDNIVATAHVQNVYDDSIVVTGNDMVVIKPNTVVKFSLREDQNSRSTTYVGLVIESSAESIELSKIQLFKDFNKREYFRLNVMLDTRVQVCDDDGNLSDTVLMAKVRDLSLTGILFAARDDSLEVGQHVEILLPLSETYTYPCTICRKVTYLRSTGYGCSFDDLDAKQEDCLCNYLFEQQRKEIQRTKR